MRKWYGMTVKFGKKQKNTIQEKLNEYLKMLLLFILLFLILVAGFCVLVTVKVADNNDHILAVNRFFDELDEEHNMLYNAAFRTSAGTMEELQQNYYELQEELSVLGAKKISVEYQRAMEDLSNLLEAYEKLVLRVSHRTADMRILNEGRSIYAAMNGYIQPLCMEILKAGKSFTSYILNMILWYLGCLLATMALVIVYTVLKNLEIIRGITNPLQQLTEQMYKINFLNGEGSETIQAQPQYHQELNQIISGYNQMLEKNRKLLSEHAELMNTKLFLQKQELLKLQHQINPHFLFNTLNLISHTAYLENDKKVVSLIGITANLLRYSLDYSSREVTLRQELEAIRNYVSIQEQRFEERITFAFSLTHQEEFDQLRMPSLMLQPLVENAIVHGLGTCEEGGRIQICTRYDPQNGIGRVCVVDNGTGMDPDTLHAVQERMRSTEDKTKSIGLANVYFRLKLFFGERADIEISSIPGERTEVALVMPYPAEGEEVCIR